MAAAIGGTLADLDARWTPQPLRFSRRLLTAVSVSAAAYLAAAVACLLLIDRPGLVAPAEGAMLVLAYLLATQVRFELGPAFVLGTEVTLVPMVLLLPVGAVPLLVGAAMLAGAALAVFTGRLPADRLLSALASSWHVMGPVAVIAIAGVPEPDTRGWPVYVLMFGAQLAVEAVSDTVLNVWDDDGRSWADNLRDLLVSQTVDALMFPVGLLAAVAAMSTGNALWALLTVPVVLLLTVADWERRRRVRQSRARLEALDRERERGDAALERVGEAMGTLLDPDALVELAVLSAGEAVAAEVVALPGSNAAPPADEDVAAFAEAMRRRAVAGNRVTVGEEGGLHGLAVPVGGLPERTALVCVRPGQAFDTEARHRLVTLASQLSAGLRAADTHERLRHLAETDHLTGLWNHRRFQEDLRAAMARRGCTALVLIDLDDFKAINDAHGHQTGDMVLSAVGGLLRDGCREQDRPARYGGEELAVVLPSATWADARSFAERIRRDIADLRVEAPGGARVHVTASVGVALSCPGTQTPETLIAAADAALFEAKRGGKDRVAGAAPAVHAS
ncbi:MAG: GGDEF domain-containing protein [Thermoleophilia bacterium]